MKRIIAFLIALSMFSISVFAAPASMAASLGNPVPLEVKSEAAASFTLNTDDDLFADVNATQLTDEEAQAVEGEGFWGALIGGIIGGVSSALVLIGTIIENPPTTPKDIIGTTALTIIGVGIGTLGGILAGTMLPF